MKLNKFLSRGSNRKPSKFPDIYCTFSSGSELFFFYFFNAIVTVAIDKEGVIFRPGKGIPLRSALSPFFGALALAPLDKAFSGKDVFYSRYQDDIIILIQTKNQFIKAKKLLFKVLGSLHLAISPEKTRLGRLKDFHFLGIKFEVSQNPQNQIQSTATMHPRSCARALEKVKTLRANAVCIRRIFSVT